MTEEILNKTQNIIKEYYPTAKKLLTKQCFENEIFIYINIRKIKNQEHYNDFLGHIYDIWENAYPEKNIIIIHSLKEDLCPETEWISFGIDANYVLNFLQKISLENLLSRFPELITISNQIKFI